MSEHEHSDGTTGSFDPDGSLLRIAEGIEAAVGAPASIEEEMMLEAAELAEVEIVEVETTEWVDFETTET